MEDEKLREVYVVEVMETPMEDRVLKVYGDPEDAKKAVDGWRAQNRKARTWVEPVLWS